MAKVVKKTKAVKTPLKATRTKTASPKSKSPQAKPAKVKASQASFVVSLNADSTAPKNPRAKEIQSAFARAWGLVPVSRRPEIPAAYLAKIAVDIIVVSDEKIAELNAAHLKHKGPTDVLSFPLGEFDPERRAYNLGEIVVSFETARQESIERELPYEEELLRYCVHGFLHLLGYDDSTKTQRVEMFEVQEKALVGK